MSVTATRKTATQKAKEYYRLGNAKLLQKDLKGALECYTKSIRIYPSFSRAYYKRGNVRRLVADLQGAIRDYDKAISMNPRLAEAYNNRGLVKFDLGDSEGGNQDLLKAGRLGYHEVYNVIKTYCR